MITNAEFAGTDIALAIFLVLELSSIANVTVFVAVVVFAAGGCSSAGCSCCCC